MYSIYNVWLWGGGKVGAWNCAVDQIIVPCLMLNDFGTAVHLGPGDTAAFPAEKILQVIAAAARSSLRRTRSRHPEQRYFQEPTEKEYRGGTYLLHEELTR
jgi:hypothetical protein